MRYVKARVVNRDRKRGGSTRQIPVLDYDGKTLVIQDGVEVEISEYVYNSLLDAKYEDIVLIKDDPDKPARKETHVSQRIEVIKMGDFYEKGDEVEKVEEAEVIEEVA